MSNRGIIIGLATVLLIELIVFAIVFNGMPLYK